MNEVMERRPGTETTERFPLDLHHCLNRCGIMRIGKGHCYACERLFAPTGLHVVPGQVCPDPHPNELAGRAPAAAALRVVERPWSTLPRVDVGVASHLPHTDRRTVFAWTKRLAASHHPAWRILVGELKAFSAAVAVCVLALFCCFSIIRAFLAIEAVAELTK